LGAVLGGTVQAKGGGDRECDNDGEAKRLVQYSNGHLRCHDLCVVLLTIFIILELPRQPHSEW